MELVALNHVARHREQRLTATAKIAAAAGAGVVVAMKIFLRPAVILSLPEETCRDLPTSIWEHVDAHS